MPHLLSPGIRTHARTGEALTGEGAALRMAAPALSVIWPWFPVQPHVPQSSPWRAAMFTTMSAPVGGDAGTLAFRKSVTI